jgi:DDE superfamily endonuclease
MIITVDGTDCAIWEPKHNNLPKDKRFFSHKKNRAAVKYLVALAIFSPHVVFIDGPFPAGQFNDIAAFRSRLKDKINKGKKVIADGGFPPNRQSTTELDMLVLPRQGYSSKDFANFKSRARARQEQFNSRLKFYDCLGGLFRHGVDKHKHAFEAVCVTLQYAMDLGEPIFDVIHHDGMQQQQQQQQQDKNKRQKQR